MLSSNAGYRAFLHPDPCEADIQMDFGDHIGTGANFDEMTANSFYIVHFSRFCVIFVAGLPVDDVAHDEVRAVSSHDVAMFRTARLCHCGQNDWKPEVPPTSSGGRTPFPCNEARIPA